MGLFDEKAPSPPFQPTEFGDASELFSAFNKRKEKIDLHFESAEGDATSIEAKEFMVTLANLFVISIPTGGDKYPNVTYPGIDEFLALWSKAGRPGKWWGSEEVTLYVARCIFIMSDINKTQLENIHNIRSTWFSGELYSFIRWPNNLNNLRLFRKR